MKLYYKKLFKCRQVQFEDSVRLKDGRRCTVNYFAYHGRKEEVVAVLDENGVYEFCSVESVGMEWKIETNLLTIK